jgi:hypothetical protein
MTDQEIENRFDELIGLVSTLGDTPRPVSQRAQETRRMAEACAAAHALIGELSPGDKTFRPQLEALLEGNQRGLSKPSVCCGVLQAAQTHFADGFAKLRSAATADAFSDLLEMAEHLHEQGFRLPAVALCGAVLEDALRKVHEARIGPWRGPGDPSIQKYNDALYALYRQGTFPEYDNTQQKDVVAWGGLRNDADHRLRSNSEELPFLGKDGSALPVLDPAKVEAMITGVRNFVARFRP